MGASVISSESEIRRIMAAVCGSRELMILVTPYMRFESNFLSLEDEALHARITMTAEETTYGLRSPDLRFRFPYHTRFLEGRTRLLGFGLLEGRRTLRLSLPKALGDDDLRRAYRAERVGKVPVTFSTPRFELRSGVLVNISSTGARLYSPQEPLDAFLKAGDTIAVSIPLAEAIRIDGQALVRWIQGKIMGVEFQPALRPEVLAPLSRWIFQRREEDKDRITATVIETPPVEGRIPGLLLVSPSQELEDDLKALFGDLLPVRRVGAAVPAVKEAVSASPDVVVFHVADAGLDSRRRLKALVEVAGARVPVVLLGSQLDNSVLFDLGTECKAAAVYGMSGRPGSFFLRLVQGILRRQTSDTPRKADA